MLFIFIFALSAAMLLPLYRIWRHNNSAENPYIFRAGTNQTKMVLLHGLTGSHTYWNPLIDDFKDSFSIIAPDLIGFGHSVWPSTGYSMEDQIAALEPHLPQKFVLVGHSMGSLIAIEIARRWPDRVSSLVLLAPPSIYSRVDLKNILSKQSKAESIMVLDSLWAPVACHVHEMLGKLSFYLMRPFVSDSVPDNVVVEGTLHRWESYNQSLEKIIIKYQATREIGDLKVPYLILVGMEDGYSKNVELKPIAKSYVEIPGSHNFLWEHPAEVISEIHKFLK